MTLTTLSNVFIILELDSENKRDFFTSNLLARQDDMCTILELVPMYGVCGDMYGCI